jgi:hypothetical protein
MDHAERNSRLSSVVSAAPVAARLSIDQKSATTPENAAQELKEAAVHGDILLLLNRHGASEFVGLSVENNGMSSSSR